MRRYFYTLLMLLSALTASAVEVVISDGIDNGALKTKMERTMSAFLTEANAAQSAKREMNYKKLGIATDVQISVSMLWENSPFVCEDEEIVEKCIKTGTGYQVRNIPLSMRPVDDAFVDSEYQEAVFSFDRNGNLSSFYLTIDANLYMQVIKSNLEVVDMRRRQLILDYVEKFKTAYNQKDRRFLEEIFSDDALIITGKVIQRKSADNIPLPPKIEYTKQTKRQYLTKLASVFDNSKYIRVTFDEIEVKRHPLKTDFYGVTLHQGYSTDKYHDDGYVFLLWDFRDESHPTIHVRTWQPDSYNTGTGKSSRIPKEDIFSIYDFDGFVDD